MAQSLPPAGLSWLLGAIFPTENSGNIPPDSIEQAHSADEITDEEPKLLAVSSEPESPPNTFRELEPFPMLIRPDLERNVRRRLKGLHLFMITINGTLGVGLYWRGGHILRVGGPLAIVLSFLINGVLAWGVMQSITELLCIWPIPGALDLYVSEFVEPELGIAVGIAYWYTYSVSFAALIATVASEISFFGPMTNAEEGGLVFFLLVAVLVLINAFKIEIYGFNEIVGGMLKSIFFVTICTTLVAIKCGAHAKDAKIPVKNPVAPYDAETAQNWGEALLMSISSAAFAYIGVEIVAASALEARWPRPPAQNSEGNGDNQEARNDVRVPLIGQTIQKTAAWVPILAMSAYFVGGLLISLIIRWDDPLLPRFSWIQDRIASKDPNRKTSSAFVAIADYSGIPKLATIFNIFLIFTAITCASTNLYVASRALFAMTSRLQSGGPGQPILIRGLAWLGKTNRYKVPMRCIIASTLAFCWVPFLTLVNHGGTSTITPIDAFVDILSQMGSDGVIIVWACECLAFIRFYYCMRNHQEYFRANKVAQVQRFNYENDDYPYRGHGQPFTAWVVFILCVVVLLVCNGASLWKKFYIEPFLSAYLTLICFLILWLVLKIIRGAGVIPQLVDLSKPDAVLNIVKRFNQMRFRGTDDEDDPPNIWNLWGII